MFGQSPTEKMLSEMNDEKRERISELCGINVLLDAENAKLKKELLNLKRKRYNIHVDRMDGQGVIFIGTHWEAQWDMAKLSILDGDREIAVIDGYKSVEFGKEVK